VVIFEREREREREKEIGRKKVRNRSEKIWIS